MTTSDFPAAVARLSEGFCPLCDHDLRTHDVIAFDNSKPVYSLRLCDGCDVSWSIDTSVVGAGPQLIPSRKLTPKEINRLYARKGKGVA